MRHSILGRTLAEPVHPAYPVGHQVRPVRRARSRRIRAMSTMTRASSDLNQRRGESQATGRPFSSSHHNGNQPSATPHCPGHPGHRPGQLRP
jgi:hypothetical protein